MREILINAVHKYPSFLLPLVIFVGQVFRSCDQNRVFSPSHPWIMDILLLLNQLYGLSGSSSRLCLQIQIIFKNLSLCISTFLGMSSDAEDSCEASINKMLQREVVKNRGMQQVQQSMTESPVYEVDEVYDKIEDRSKKAVAANLGADKVSSLMWGAMKKAVI